MNDDGGTLLNLKRENKMGPEKIFEYTGKLTADQMQMNKMIRIT